MSQIQCFTPQKQATAIFKKKLGQTILIVQYLACRWKFSETCLNFYSSGYSASLSQALVKIFNIETDEIFITLQAALFSTNKEEEYY